MTTIINGSSPSITFSDSTTQTTAFTSTPSVTSITTSADASISGLTVGKGGGAVSTNTAVGASALAANTTGSSNVAVGLSALAFNTTGTTNSAVGLFALRSNTTGSNNTALGEEALWQNTTASNNTAVGYQAGYSSTTTNNSTYIGATAGYNTTGRANTFIGRNDNGFGSGYFITTGNRNTILGGFDGNTGGIDIRTASNNIVLSDGDGNPRLSYLSGAATWYSVEIYNSTTASAANINVSSGGNISRSTSALKYKQDIRDIENIDISKFRPVRYKSKCANDDQTLDHFGIVADEVDAAGIKELVNYGAEGEVEGFQYERLTVVLLKSLQELKAEFDAYKASHP